MFIYIVRHEILHVHIHKCLDISIHSFIYIFLYLNILYVNESEQFLKQSSCPRTSGYDSSRNGL